MTTTVGEIELRRLGSGPPLVYLHSAVGEGEGFVLLDRLAQHVDVVAPMFPGYGESEGIERIDDMEDVAFHLLDVWDRLGLDAPAVVGNSLGGWMALELAVRHPERVSALVLVNPVGLHIEGAPIKDVFGRSPAELAGDFFADPEHPMAQTMRMLSELRSSDVPFDVVRPLYQTMSATARLAWDPYLHNPKLAKRLHRVNAPTLIVRGAQDTLVPRAHAEAYASAIAGARLVEVERAAHLLAVERPDELARLVVDFLGIVEGAQQ
ncbi:MAG TPA: alpha/beta hydrolase [Acidimicrobiales bacterium]|nr:alpha/beta hydrolase [Acidimicrobiales bacterium]